MMFYDKYPNISHMIARERSDVLREEGVSSYALTKLKNIQCDDYDDIALALRGMFLWSSSSQGDAFWRHIHTTLQQDNEQVRLDMLDELESTNSLSHSLSTLSELSIKDVIL